MQGISNKIGLPLLASFFIIGGILLVIGARKRWQSLFGGLGVHWFSRLFLDNFETDQQIEYRQFFYYVIGIISILLGIILLFQIH